MDEKKIKQIFKKFSSMRAIVIGDAMLDTYLWGNVERISPEAPIPVVSVNKRESRLGGAANVALNLKALGATPVLFSVTGYDVSGQEFRNLIETNNLSASGIFEDPGRPTTVKSRIIGKGKHIARVDEESTQPLNPELTEKLGESILREVETGQTDVIIYVDYDKGLISSRLFETVNSVAAAKNIPVAVDPKKRNFLHYRNVGLFKPNFYEFTDGIGVQLAKGDFEGLSKAARAFKTEQNIQTLLITLSELGVFVSNGEEDVYSQAVIREIADVSGAGDTVLAVVSLAMVAGLSSRQIALMANLAGGLVCETPGVVPVDQEKLIRLMEKEKF